MNKSDLYQYYRTMMMTKKYKVVVEDTLLLEIEDIKSGKMTVDNGQEIEIYDFAHEILCDIAF